MNPTMNPTANDDSILVDGFKPYKQDHLQDYIPTPTPAAAAAVSQWPKQVDVVDETTARRYCWGRMKKWQFILFCSVGGFLVFLALALAIVYLAVLPSILPKIFWDLIFKGDWTHLQIHSVAINRTTDTGFWTNIYMTSVGLTLPVYFVSAEMRPSTFTMKNMDTGRTIGEIVLSTPLFLTGWDSTLFDLKNFGFNFPDPEATRDFVADLSAWFSQNMTNNLLEDPPTYRISIDALVDVKVIHIPISKVNFRTEQRLEFASLFANIDKLGKNAKSFVARIPNSPSSSTPLKLISSRAAFSVSSPSSSSDNIDNYDAFSSKVSYTASTSQPFYPDGTLTLGPVTVSNLGLRVNGDGAVLRSNCTFINPAQPLGLKFGDVDIALHLDNANIAHLIIRGIELVPQTLDFSLNVDLVPVDVHGVGDVAKISNAVSRLAVGALDVMAGINGALIKNENNDTLPWLDTILSGLKIDIPVTSLFSGGAGSLFSSLNLEKLDINLEKNNTISILPNITLPPLLSADIQIAPLSAQLQSDSGITLISASIDAISLKGTGLQVLAPSVKLLLSPQEDAAVALGKTLSGAVFNAPSYLAIGVVHVGDVSGRLNMLFSAIRIRISINKLIYPATADPSIDVKPAITPVAAASVSLPARLGASLKFSSGDSSSFTSSDAFLAASLVSDSVSSSLPQRPAATLDLTLNQGSIDATALGISAKLALKLISQLPINTLIPYLSLRTGLDDLDAIRLDMIGLGLAKGAKDYDIGIDLVFGQDQGLPAKIAEIVNGLVNSESKITSNIIVQGLRLGPSIEESYGLLDRLNVSIPGFAISLLPQLLKKNESEVAAAAASTTAPLFNFHMDGLDGFSLGTVAPQIDSLDISTGSSSFVFGAGASLYNPFPISLSIPFAGVSAIVDGSNVANADLTGLVIGKSGRQSVNLALALGFSTAADVPGKVARLVNGLIAGKIDSSITLTGIMFGISRSQSVKALSLLELPLNLSGIRSSSSSGFSLASIFPALANAKLSSLIPTINSLDIATAPRATLEAGIGAFLSNSLPVTLDVPYLAASLLLNGRQMLALTLQGAKIGRGANSINVKLSAALSNDAQIQGDVSRIVKDLVSGKGVTGVTVAISGILVGPNSQEAVHALEQVIFDIPLTGGSSIDLSQILPWINNINLGSFKPSLAGLDISTIEQGLSVEGALSIHNPIPVTAKIGYLSLSAALGDAQLLDLSVSDIQLVLSDQSIALHATLAIGRNPVLKQRVADLVRKVAAGGPIEFNLGGVFIGTSSSDVIATFGNIGLPLSFSLKGGPSLLNGLLGGGENGTMDGKNPLSLKDIFKQTDGFDISTTDYGLDIEYKGIIFNPLPISLKVDYFAIQAQLANAGILAELDVGLSLGRGETPVSATLAIRLDRDARLADEVKTIVQDYFSKTDYNGLSLGGLSFGVSRIKAFDTLSLAFIPVKLPFSTMGSLSTLYGLGAADGKDVTVVAGGSNVNEQDGFLSFAKIMEFFKSALGPSSTLDVATTDYGLSAGFIGVINNTLPLSAHVGYFSIDVNLAGEAGRLARLEASLDLEKGSKAPINLGLRLVLSRGRAIAESVKEVFDDFIGKINYKGLAIGGIRLGSSEEKAFDLLSKAFINIPLNFEATPVLSSASLPVSTANPDPPAKPNIKAKLQQMMSFIEGIDIKTSSTGFSVVAGLSLSDVGMNLKIFVGHVSVDFLVSKVRLLTLAVDDLKFAGERVSVLHIPGSIIFSPEDPNIADSVADFINPLLRGETLSSLPFDLTNLKIGASAENAFDTFSLVDLDIQKLIFGEFAAAAVSTEAEKDGSSASTSEKSSINFPLLEVSTEDTGIAIVAKVQFGALGIPLTVTAGYISLGVDLLKDVRLTTAIIENASLAAGESETDLSVEHALLQLVPEDPQLPPLFAGIVNPIITALVSKTPLPIEKLTVFFTDLHFGPSSSDAFKCLSKIVYPMVIDLKSLFTGSSSLAVPVVGMSSDELPAPETKSSSSFIQGLEITATDVGLSAGLKLNLTQLNLPKLSIKIGYLDAGIFAGSSPTTLSKLGSVDVAKLDGSTLSPDLDLGLSLDVTGRDAAALDFVAALVNAVLPALPVPTKPGTVPPPPPPPPSAFVSLSSLYFGSSAEHKISLLSQVVLTLDAIKLIGSGRVGAEKSVGEDVSVIAEEETQAPSVSVKSVKGELGKNSLILDLGLALPLPFPLVAKLGYAGLRIDMSDKKIATGALMLTNLAVNPGGSTEARVELAFDETAASRLRLQQLILQLTNTVDKSDQIFFKQVVFGASSATKVDLFSKVNYRLPLKFKLDVLGSGGPKVPSLPFKISQPFFDVALSSKGVTLGGSFLFNTNLTAFDLNLGQMDLRICQGKQKGLVEVVPSTNIVNASVKDVTISNGAKLKLDVNVDIDANVPQLPYLYQILTKNETTNPNAAFTMFGQIGLKSSTGYLSAFSTVMFPVLLAKAAYDLSKTKNESSSFLTIGNINWGTIKPDGYISATIQVNNSAPINLDAGRGSFSLARNTTQIAELKSDVDVVFKHGENLCHVDIKLPVLARSQPPSSDDTTATPPSRPASPPPSRDSSSPSSSSSSPPPLSSASPVDSSLSSSPPLEGADAVVDAPSTTSSLSRRSLRNQIFNRANDATSAFLSGAKGIYDKLSDVAKAAVQFFRTVGKTIVDVATLRAFKPISDYLLGLLKEWGTDGLGVYNIRLTDKQDKPIEWLPNLMDGASLVVPKGKLNINGLDTNLGILIWKYVFERHSIIGNISDAAWKMLVDYFWKNPSAIQDIDNIAAALEAEVPPRTAPGESSSSSSSSSESKSSEDENVNAAVPPSSPPSTFSGSSEADDRIPVVETTTSVTTTEQRRRSRRSFTPRL